ncbi:radical SAM protein [Geoalkalibacter sp.]|uniref:radical SAM protein n=1 Tax=Geoalkalibacter sp. TaxID=3041440 RepID=UPI00272E578A|nr:radical SAM protein [Geoalkalibacter sp.]
MAREELIARNREEYGERYGLLKFPGSGQAAAALSRRDALLECLAAKVAIGCGGTKLDCNRLSPGCAVCVAGRWSCLFINGTCNRTCFYCPSPQDEVGRPTTNSLEFPHPQDYVDYIATFGFTGVSFSGGEPLLTPERTLSYLKAVKERFGADLHVWLYTNGTLVTPEILGALRDAGLDEIRFDIGATDYQLKKAAAAVGVIPTVTVEIPAVPEEQELLRARIAEMADLGIAHLNLHQLRLTPYNFERFQGRGYTFLHGEKVTVLESELCALELIRDSLERGIDLPINYCSFVYKNLYQAQAARTRNGRFAAKGHEALTPAGYLRGLALTGAAETILRQVDALRLAGAESEQWQLSRAKDRLSFHPALSPLLALDDLELRVNYAEAVQRPAISYRFPFVEVPINATRKIVIERRPSCGEILLSAADGRAALRALREGGALDGFAHLAPFEALKTGLQEYF